MDVKSYFFSAIKAPIEKNSMVSRLNPVVCISILKISPKDNAIIVIKAYLEAVYKQLLIHWNKILLLSTYNNFFTIDYVYSLLWIIYFSTVNIVYSVLFIFICFNKIYIIVIVCIVQFVDSNV